jgi:pimeloyl-[acyl-carrier protein] methyl ester esterase
MPKEKPIKNALWVLLPGLDGTGLLFDPFVQALEARGQSVRVLRYPDQAWGYEALFAWLHAELVDLPAGSVLLAESFSGPLGVMLAAENRFGFSKLILCATFVRCPSQLAQVFKPGLNWLSVFAPALSFFSAFAPTVSIERSLFNDVVPEPLRPKFKQAMHANSAYVAPARMQAILNVDVSAHLRKVAIPIIYLQAGADRLVGAHCLQEISTIKPQVQVLKFDTAHCLLQLKPFDAVNALLAIA